MASRRITSSSWRRDEMILDCLHRAPRARSSPLSTDMRAASRGEGGPPIVLEGRRSRESHAAVASLAGSRGTARAARRGEPARARWTGDPPLLLYRRRDAPGAKALSSPGARAPCEELAPRSRAARRARRPLFLSTPYQIAARAPSGMWTEPPRAPAGPDLTLVSPCRPTSGSARCGPRAHSPHGARGSAFHPASPTPSRARDAAWQAVHPRPRPICGDRTAGPSAVRRRSARRVARWPPRLRGHTTRPVE